MWKKVYYLKKCFRNNIMENISRQNDYCTGRLYWKYNPGNIKILTDRQQYSIKDEK